ncbi:MAG: uroporphyrinogen decarboxylase family protein [Saccharofermentanales bacterium]
MISDRDLLKATVQRKREERILYYAGFVGDCVKNVHEFYNVESDYELAKQMGFFIHNNVSGVRKPDAPVYDYKEYFKDVKIPENIKIEPDGILNLPGSNFHFTHLISPLRDVYSFDEILKFPIYKKPEYYDFSTLKEQTEKIHSQDIVASAFIGRLFETSWPLRGYENMLADMLGEPEIVEYFLNMELEWNIEYTTQAVKAGVDIIYFGDDVGNQNGMTFSADMWRKMIKPKWDKIFSAAKKINPDVAIWYHSCGNVTDIISDLIDVGLDILNPIQPECMDIYGIQKKYGDKLSFDGGVGTQHLMPFGKPDEVAAEIKRLVEVFGENGGFILSPSHVLEPEVPMGNIDAFIKTAQKACKRQ